MCSLFASLSVRMFKSSVATGYDVPGICFLQSAETQAYSIIFLVLFFILILNFVLAIIVDAYMNVRRVVRSSRPQ